MKADGEFIGNVGFMVQPIARIAKQGSKPLRNFMVGNTKILLRGSIDSRPLPGLIKHTQMEISYVGFDKRIIPTDIVGCEGPRVRFENILSLPFIELIFGGQIGDEIGPFLGGQRCIPFPFREKAHRMPRFLSSRLVSVSTASPTRPTA